MPRAGSGKAVRSAWIEKEPLEPLLTICCWKRPMEPLRHRLPWEPPGLPAKPWVREVMKAEAVAGQADRAEAQDLLSATVMEPPADMELTIPVELGLAAQ